MPDINAFAVAYRQTSAAALWKEPEMQACWAECKNIWGQLSSGLTGRKCDDASGYLALPYDKLLQGPHGQVSFAICYDPVAPAGRGEMTNFQVVAVGKLGAEAAAYFTLVKGMIAQWAQVAQPEREYAGDFLELTGDNTGGKLQPQAIGVAMINMIPNVEMPFRSEKNGYIYQIFTASRDAGGSPDEDECEWAAAGMAQKMG